MTDVSKITSTALTDANNASVTAEMENQELRRLANYKEYWKLYKGQHWSHNEVDGSKPAPALNKCFIFVNKSIAFLVGNPPTVNYPLPEVEAILAPFVARILKNSGGIAKFTWEAAQMGSVTGDCFIKPVFDPAIGVRLQVNDSADVKVRYTFRDYQNDIPEKAEIFWNYYDIDKEKVCTYREIWTAQSKSVYIDDVPQPAETGSNLLGQVPLIHIRNLPVGKEVYGMSDIEQLEDLNKLLNASIRRFMDDVDYNGDPVTLLFGVRINQLEKGEGKMWGNLPIKSKVENLTLDTDFPAQQKFIEYIDDACHQVGNVVKNSVVGNTAISNTSGVALHMNNLPLIELTDRKKITYGSGFTKAVKMALDLELYVELQKESISRMSKDEKKLRGIPNVPYIPSGIIQAVNQVLAIYRKQENPIYRTYDWNEVEFKFQDYLPKDKLVEMQLIKDEITLGLESRKGAMKRLGKDNIDALLAEIDSDMEARMKLKQLYGDPSGNTSQGMQGPGDTSSGAVKEVGEKK